MTARWIGAAIGIAILANLVALVPVWQERTGVVVRIPMAVCGVNLSGGYGEHDRLRIHLAVEMRDDGASVDPTTLAAIGFNGDAIARLGDPGVDTEPLPEDRAAWIRLRQRPDSTREWQVLDIGATRESVSGDGLIVRGIVGFGYASRTPPGTSVIASVHSVSPRWLHVGSPTTERLRRLRGATEGCSQTEAIALGNGSRGAVWVTE